MMPNGPDAHLPALGRAPSDAADVTSRRLVALARGGFACITICFVAVLVLSALAAAGPEYGTSAVVNEWMFWLAMFTFPVTGVLIVGRQPRNAIGWILLAIGLVWAYSAVTDVYVWYGVVVAPGSLPRPDLVVALTAMHWVPAVGLMGTFLLLLFPDGRLPSRRWRPFAWFTACVLVGLTVTGSMLPGRLPEMATEAEIAARLPDVANPLGVAALAPVVAWVFPLVMLVPLCIVGCALGLIARYRRSRGRERLQLTWLVAAGAVTAAIYGAAMVLSVLFGGELTGDPGPPPAWLRVLQTISVPAFALIPVAIGVAILRHRLYDIDRLISRTVTYAIVVTVLGAVYVGVVAALTQVLPLTGDVAVAASTLAAAALFRPVQRRTRHAVDRRFNRARFDAEREVERFARRLRTETDLRVVEALLGGVIAQTLQPTAVSVWFAAEGRDSHAR